MSMRLSKLSQWKRNANNANVKRRGTKCSFFRIFSPLNWELPSMNSRYTISAMFKIFNPYLRRNCSSIFVCKVDSCELIIIASIFNSPAYACIVHSIWFNCTWISVRGEYNKKVEYNSNQDETYLICQSCAISVFSAFVEHHPFSHASWHLLIGEKENIVQSIKCHV